MIALVRTLEELNKLVEEGKTTEITREEWEAIDIILNALLDLLEPIHEEITKVTEFLNWFGEWYKKLASNLD